MCVDLLTRAFRGVYPFQSEDVQAFFLFGKDKLFESPQEVVELVEQQVLILEEKVNHYERATKKA